MIGRLERLRRFARGRFRTWKPHLAGMATGAVSENIALIGAVRKAQALERDGTLADAAAAWEAVLAAHPAAAIPYAGLGNVSRQLNRQDEAHAVLSAGARLFPDDLNILFELAQVEQTLSHLAEAMACARTLMDRFPAEPQGYVVAGQVHRAEQRLDEADTVLREGRARCPSHVWLAIEQAAVADARGDWAEAVIRWERLRADFPDTEVGYAGLGAALKRHGRHEDAEALLTAGLARFPDDSNIGINRAWLAEDMGDWPEALRRWEALWRICPRDPRIRHGWIECQGKAGIAAADAMAEHGAGATPLVPATLPIATEGAAEGPDSPHAALFLRFESLGENCELGFTQRHFGAEPIGLIRWAGITYDQLMLGLSNGFADIGSIETTELHVAQGTHEYITIDRNFGLAMHSFINRDDPNEERIFQKLRRRLIFLRDKLLEDIALGEKIFVFEGQTPRSDAELTALHAALGRLGAARLLCIRVADAAHPPGTVDGIGDGLMFGYIDKLGLSGTHWNISHDLWIEIGTKALAMAGARSASAAA